MTQRDISRFGRDYLTVGNYLSRVFPFLGVRFIAVNDGFDSSRQGDIDSLETSFKALLYDLYSRDLSRRVRNAQRFKAQRGDFISSLAPFGYRKDPNSKNRLVIDTEAAAIVRRIFRMSADGLSAAQIARTLNEERLPTPMMYKRAAGCFRSAWRCIGENNFWTHNGVIRILRDERYMGKTVYGKRRQARAGGSKTIKVNRKDWITVEGAHEGIVTREEFDLAQANKREYVERGARRSGEGGGFFSGRVRCGICGHAMVRMKTKQPYYFCYTPREKDDCPCPEEQIPERDLMEAVLRGLRAQALCGVEAGRIRKEICRRRESDAAAMGKELFRLNKSRTGLESRIQELYERFVFGELDRTEYLKAKSAAEKMRDDLAARIQSLEAGLKNMSADRAAQNRPADSGRPYTDIEELTVELMSDALREIVVYPDRRLNIVWNYRNEF